jgi:hypothetical protein
MSSQTMPFVSRLDSVAFHGCWSKLVQINWMGTMELNGSVWSFS